MRNQLIDDVLKKIELNEVTYKKEMEDMKEMYEKKIHDLRADMDVMKEMYQQDIHDLRVEKINRSEFQKQGEELAALKDLVKVIMERNQY